MQGAAAGSSLSFEVGTETGWYYTLQRSTDLSTWNHVGSQFADNASLTWTNAFDSSAASRFYRLAVDAPNTAIFTNYHGWTNAVSLNNGIVEAIVIPNTGRLQQFRLLSSTVISILLWENSQFYGKAATNTSTTDYDNFGGDKAWPSPQSHWGWPPPRGFDGRTNTVSFTNGIVTLVSTVDTNYNIRVTRNFELLFDKPVMRVQTIFERVGASTNVNLGVWIDCQAVASTSSRCYVPVPTNSIFPNGYTTNGSAQFTGALPTGFTNINGMISFGVDGSPSRKVGFDSSSLAMVGRTQSLRIDAPRIPGATYPDGNCSTEVYTTPDYFELEMLGPLADLPVGGQMELVTTYSLHRRTETTSDAEAKKILSYQY
jgi:hypothetical protein